MLRPSPGRPSKVRGAACAGHGHVAAGAERFRVLVFGVWGCRVSFRAWADLLADTESPAAKRVGFCPVQSADRSLSR